MSKLTTLALGLAALALACGGGGNDGDQGEATRGAALPPDITNMTPRVVLETTKGRIVLELDRERAQRTVDHILLHVRNRFYDGLTFHRVMPGFMIQTGAFTPAGGMRQSPRPQLQNESDNGLSNVRGSVAMARLPEPHSASTQFYINLSDNLGLDYNASTGAWGYTVFGRVVEGMDVVDAIAAVDTEPGVISEAVPVEPIIIERAYMEEG
jgi:cyclophilin family peptidyl-prolyl cis-trans isomerase